jgi:acetylornithine aminotransferase
MTSTAIIQRASQVLCDTYARQPLVLAKGQGALVWDADGNQYLDFVAGLAVCSLGHSHPAVAAAVAAQARELVHTSNIYYTENQVRLAEWLTAKSGMDRVFFCNSGAEANEAAIKCARKTMKDRGRPERFEIITMEGSFHGRTLATLTATGQDKVKHGFEPLPQGFVHVPFDDLAAVRAAVTDKTCAVMVEPVQGEGGVRVPSPGYLAGLSVLCAEAGILLILDEIQCGMGRTGKLFACSHFGVVPDILTLAKALANGLPIGAMLAKGDAARALTPGTHATTFGGTPLVCAAALAVARIFDDEDIPRAAMETGGYFRFELDALAKKHPSILGVRGMGLMLGVPLAMEGAPVVTAMRERGFLINCAQNTVLRFLPPLTIRREQVDALCDALSGILSELETKTEEHP